MKSLTRYGRINFENSLSKFLDNKDAISDITKEHNKLLQEGDVVNGKLKNHFFESEKNFPEIFAEIFKQLQNFQRKRFRNDFYAVQIIQQDV